MRVWNYFAGSFIFCLLILNFLNPVSADVKERSAKGDPQIMQLLDNPIDPVDQNASDSRLENVDGLPKILIYKMNNLLSDTLHMLEKIKDVQRRRWLESFILKVGDLASEMESAKQPHHSPPYSGQLPHPASELMRPQNKYHPTSSQLTNVIPIKNKNPTNKQVVMKTGTAQNTFYENDELIKQLHTQDNNNLQQIHDTAQTLQRNGYFKDGNNELSRRKTTDASNKYFSWVSVEEFKNPSEIHGQSVDSMNDNIPDFHQLPVIQAGAYKRDKSTTFEEKDDIQNKMEIFDHPKKNSGFSKQSSTVTTHVSQIQQPVVNAHHIYSKEKAKPNNNLFKKRNTFNPEYQQMILQAYNQVLQHGIPISQKQNQKLPFREFKLTEKTKNPFETEISNLPSQQSHYIHSHVSPKALKSIHNHYSRYSALPQMLPLSYVQSPKESLYQKEVIKRNHSNIRNHDNVTHLDFSGKQMKQNLPVKGMAAEKHIMKHSHSQHRHNNSPHFKKGHLYSQYLPEYALLTETKKQIQWNNPILDRSNNKSDIQITDPAKLDLERQLRAGKIVILSDSLVRTNFEKHPKKSTKPPAKPR